VLGRPRQARPGLVGADEETVMQARRVRLAVNPITCEGHGLCAELLPEWISLDDWGYPIVNPDPVPPELRDHARRAVAACPTLALLVRLD
jgi:ferredoxin